MDKLDLALAGLPLDSRILPLLAKDGTVPAMPPAVRPTVNPDAAPFGVTNMPQPSGGTYEDQYNRTQSLMVPGRSMTSYGVAPTYDTPERQAADKTISTPPPSSADYKPRWWERLLGGATAFAAGWGGNPAGYAIGSNVTNRRFNTAMGDYSARQEQAQNVLAEQDKNYNAQSQNWRNFLTFSQKEDELNRREERDRDRADYERRVASVGEERNRLSGERDRLKAENDNLKTPDAVFNQRQAYAKKLGLKGEDYKYYMANGKLREFAPDKGRDDGPKRGTPGQFAHAADMKARALERINSEYRKGSGRFADIDTSTPEAKDRLRQEKQQIQDSFEEKILALGGEVEHVEYPDEDTPPDRKSQSTPRSPSSGGDTTQSKVLDPRNPDHVAIAKKYLSKAGGDKNKARALARKDGYSF